MIKVIVHITKAIVAVIASLLFASCNLGINGSGNVTTENRTVNGEFTSVSADGGLEVIIEQSAQTSITVEADDNLQEHIKTEVINGKLIISFDASVSFSKANRVIVQLPNIKEISSDGGSAVSGKGVLKGSSMKITSDGGSTLEVNIDAKNVICNSEGGSSLEITGRTENLEMAATSGSSIDGERLTAKNATAHASSGSAIQINVTDKLVADATSGSAIEYVNIPAKLEKNEDSGGSVSQN
ncbi:hypothetical protein D3C87_346240 [compost metagenome]